MITHHRGSVFEAPTGAMLIHSASTRGVWGAGIAQEFRRRFPTAHEEYRSSCHVSYLNIVGQARITLEPSHWVATLITSTGVGRTVDHWSVICGYTRKALRDLVDHAWPRARVRYGRLPGDPLPAIHLPRINSGLFGVPWSRTESILNEDHPNLVWNVWTP